MEKKEKMTRAYKSALLKFDKLYRRLSHVDRVFIPNQHLPVYRYRFVVFSESFKKFAVCDFETENLTFSDYYRIIEAHREGISDENLEILIEVYDYFVSQYNFNPKRLTRKTFFFLDEVCAIRKEDVSEIRFSTQIFKQDD